METLMKLHAIPLTKDGVYVFKAPAKITATLNRELLVVITSPSSKSCGAVFFSQQSHPKELIEWLAALHSKMGTTGGARAEHLRLKLFGMSSLNSSLLDEVGNWAKEKRIEVIAQDVGRSVVRHVYIECETGRIGVTYAEAYFPESENWLSVGSAQTRKATPTNNVVLVLSQNTVNRQLTRQTVEELPGWQALIAEQPFDWIVSAANNDLFPARAIVIFDDMGNGKPLEKWMNHFRKSHPEVSLFWVGKKSPSFAKSISTIATLKPQSLGIFKKSLKQELGGLTEDSSADVDPLRSEVIAFPTKKKVKARR